MELGENSEIIQQNIDQEGEFNQEILIDKNKLKQIQKENFNLSSYTGFNRSLLDKIGIRHRNHNLFYGINIQERALEASLTSNKIMIPLLKKSDINNKLQKIKPEIRNTLGWVHIGAIQILIKSTFKEGLNTPINLAIMDNRIINKEEACLGIIQGNLQYGKLKFNIYPRISYHLKDKDFDKTLSLIQDFKRKDFFKNKNSPYSITYVISYAISNTHHSDCFSIKDTIDFPYLFNDICFVQRPSLPKIEEIESSQLLLDLREKPLLEYNTMPSQLSFQNNSVTNQLKRAYSCNILPREISNYKIEGEYYNGKTFTSISIIIDTGATGSYIHPKLCKYLSIYELAEPLQYTNFNGELHEVATAVDTLLKFDDNIIPFRLLVEHETLNDNIEIMLGTSFLNIVQPYEITANGIKMTFNNNLIYIPK